MCSSPLSHKPVVFSRSSIWLCWSSLVAAGPHSRTFLSSSMFSGLGWKWLVAFKHSSSDMVIQRVEVRRVRRPFTFTNKFTAVGSNPVLSQLCSVCRRAVLLKDEARWQNTSAILNKFRQQGFNIKFSNQFGLIWNEMHSFLPTETDARRNHIIQPSYINSLVLVRRVLLSLLSAMLTCGTVYLLLLILVHSVHLSDRFNM